MAEDRKKVWEKVRKKYEELKEDYEQRMEDDFPQDVFALSSISLARIVEVQREFQGKCKPVKPERFVQFLHQAPGTGLPRAGDPLWREMLRVNVLACISEMIECLETCPWKPWKDQGDHAEGAKMSEEVMWEARLEIADAFCFMLNVWMLLGGDGAELGNLYLAKMGENHRRQEEGY